MIRVVVVDDHPHVAIAVRALLDVVPDIQLVAEATRGEELPALLRKVRPDVLLLDILMEPEFNALATVRNLRFDFPDLKICLFSAFVKPTVIQKLLQAGVHGYILKDDDYVSRIDVIIRDLYNGEIYLSHQAYVALAEATRLEENQQPLSMREIEILTLASQGLPNPQIGQALHIAPGTVRNHLSTIYRKLGVKSRHEALQIAEERKII
ncbi:MAG: response regulator transcription factor [Anaerolineales bacterium]|nr:MAG: response regulator transcription factor [Anaerolineales bacterium]